jgi:hypothetical protein
MKELCIEGLAIHGGPESCAGVREDVGEALTGVRAGRAIEPRNPVVRGADAVETRGGQHCWRRFREPSAGPVGSESLCMRGISKRENRESPRSPVRCDGGAGRSGKVEAVSPR